MLHQSVLEGNPELIHLERKKCARDKIHFINQWCLTFDPRRHPKHFPFELFPFQVELIEWIDDRYRLKENGLIEKSRDMGVSWIACAWSVHEWLFSSGFSVLFGSRKEDLVDDMTIDSLFGKMRYLIYHLPSFLRPEIRERTKTDRYLTLIHPATGNEIVGESANVGFGRGGRSSICFLDEFAHVQNSESVWASVSDNSDCIIPLSTPNGKGNQFAWLRHEAKIPTFSIHWSKHPLKSDAWYEKKKSEMKPWQIAQELDLSYERSVQARIYDRFDRRWHIADEVIECDPEMEQFITWDFGIADPTAILFGQITDLGEIEIWGELEIQGQDIDFFAPIVKGQRPGEWGLLSDETKKKILKLLAKYPQGLDLDIAHFGDHAGTARTANSKRSCKAALKEHGIHLQTSGKQTFDWRIECVDNILKPRFNSTQEEWYSILKVSPDCERFIDCMFNYKWDKEDAVSDHNLKPKHDWSSHLVTAFEFFVINRFPIRKTGGVRQEQIR